MAATSRFLVEIVRAPLRAIAADGEENIHLARDQFVHRPAIIDGTSRRTEDCPAFLMNAIHKLRREFHRLRAALRIESSVTAPQTKHVINAVAIMQLEKEGTNDVVEAAAQSPAGHNSCARFLSLKKKFRSRPRQFELQSRLGAYFNPLRYANLVTDGVAEIRNDSRFAKSVGIHRKSTIASTCAERMRNSVVRG